MKFSRGILLLVSLGSCISPYVNDSQYQESVVIEGMITDQPGPYMVKISKTLHLKDQGESPSSPVQGALVVLHDDLGNTETLVEKSTGSYYTSTTQGVIGQSYYINVTLPDGSIYKSAMEKLLPVGDFSNVRSELQIESKPERIPKGHSPNGFNIYIDSDVLPEQENRVWWRFTGTYRVVTHPELKTKPKNLIGSVIYIPNPPKCSGYISVNEKLVGPIAPCTCCICWINVYNVIPMISDPNFIINGKIPNQYVGFAEVDVRTFSDKYYLQIDQLSLSQPVYDFWKNIKIAEENSSNLFQTPPPKAKGNIVELSSNSIPVIGYFAASSIKSHAITLTVADLPTNFLPAIDTIVDVCSFRNSTLTKPTFW